MSELKVATNTKLKYELMLNKERSWVPCYLKSDVDKHIKELEESHKMEVGQLLIDIAELKARIAELEEERRWRKFPDEKPEEWDTVVVRFSDGFYDLAVYMSNGQGWDIGDGSYHKPDEVSYWMPLQKFEEK